LFRKTVFFILFSSFIFLTPAAATENFLKLTDADRILVIAPHPDDEALGLGGMIQSVLAMKAKIKIVYLTHGEANEVSALFYKKKPLLLKSDFLKNGATRKKEAVEAMSFLGLKMEDLIFFGYPDGGILNIWVKHWGNAKPFRSLLTRINKVSHREDFSYGHTYKGDNIVHDFEKVLLAFGPTHIFVTAPFDLNSDHQAAFLFLKVALLNLSEQLKPAPPIHYYLIHAHQWPSPKGRLLSEPLTAPDRTHLKNQIQWNAYAVPVERVTKKEELILKYKSQIAYKKNFLLSFARTNELFCDDPIEKLLSSPKSSIEEFASRRSLPLVSQKTDEVVYERVGEELWLEVLLTSALDEIGVLSLSIFSYRQGLPFAEMPKLVFKLFGKKMVVYEGSRSIYNPAIVYKIDKDRLQLRIPLETLKNPDTIFVSTRSAKEEINLDFGSWKVLEVADR